MRRGGGVESSGPWGGGLRNLATVPITMACGRVTRALLGCMLMLATSLSMVVEEGDTSQVSLRIKGQSHMLIEAK